MGGIQNARGHFHGNTAIGAITILHERTRLINGGRGGRAVGPATIRNVLDLRNKTTELWIADSLLCAIGQPGILRYGGDVIVEGTVRDLTEKEAISLKVVRVIQNPGTGRPCGCCA